MEQWKTRIMILGAVLGAISGIIAAFIVIQRAEDSHHQPQITAGDGVKVGLGVLGVLRLIADIGSTKK